MIMSLVLSTVLLLLHVLAPPPAAPTLGAKSLRPSFNSFKRDYLLVYSVIMLADWMQGTHMYTLYQSYGVNVSALFLTGFLSGAFFAPWMGGVVDTYGRR